jgi:hypothetical protein
MLNVSIISTSALLALAGACKPRAYNANTASTPADNTSATVWVHCGLQCRDELKGEIIVPAELCNKESTIKLLQIGLIKDDVTCNTGMGPLRFAIAGEFKP